MAGAVKSRFPPGCGAQILATLLGLSCGATAIAQAPPTPVATLRLEIALQGVSPAPRRGAFELRPLSAPSEASKKSEVVDAFRSIPIEAALPAIASLPAGSRWEVALKMPGYWAHPETVEVGPPGTASVRSLEVWPTGTITGRVRMADAHDKPVKSLLVSTLVSPLPGSSKVPEERWTCPVDPMARFSCELPARTFDLSLSADGFIPEYRWATAISAGKTADLGSVELKGGASVAGWIQVEEGALVPGRCITRLLPLSGAGGGATSIKLEKTAVSAPIRKDGFFQLRGVAPGSYLLQGEQPGYAPARAFPIEVWPGTESLVTQPLILHRPLTIRFDITPPVDWVDRPWRVQVIRFSDFSANLERQPAFDGVASRDGRVAVPGQSAGRYLVNVHDSLGNSLFGDPQVEITGPADAQREISIDLITVDGRLRFGKEPLAATLWFGSPFSMPGVKMTSDEKGHFQGVLPRAGRWEVQIESASPPVRTVRSAKVEPDRVGRAKVEISLPDVKVFGHVVDEDGQPVTGAEVGIDMEHTSDSVRTDASGSFSSRGLDAGFATLVARARSPRGKSSSEAATAFLRDGEETGPVELHLRAMRSLGGKIVSPLGPVAGATVSAAPVGSEQFEVDEATTDLDGSFSLQLPARSASAFVYVSAPGNAFQAFQVPLDGTPATLAVQADSGAVEVAVPYTRGEIDERNLAPPWFVEDGIPIPSTFLKRWALGHGEPYSDAAYTTIRIAHLAPGAYQVCFAARPQVIAAHHAAWSTPPGDCAAGSLSAGGTLHLAPRPESSGPAP